MTTSAVYGFFKFTSKADGRSGRCEVKKLPFTFGSSLTDDIRIHAPKVQKGHLQVLRLGSKEEEGENHGNKLIIRPSLSEFLRNVSCWFVTAFLLFFVTDATVLVNEKVLEMNAEYALSHNDRVSIEGRCFTFEAAATSGLADSFIEGATVAEITTAEATLPVAAEEEKKNSPLRPVVEASLETLSTTAVCRTPTFVSLKKPSNPVTTAAAASALKVKSTPSRIPRCALKTAATTTTTASTTSISGSAKRQPLSVQFNRFSEQKGLTSRKRVYVPTKLFDGEKPSKLNDIVAKNAENALSRNDLVTTVEQSHNSLTASFIEMETTTAAAETALPAAEEEEDNSLLHSVVGADTTTVDCQTPTFVTLKEPNSSAKSAAVVKSTPTAAAAVPRRALKTAAKTTGLTSRQLPNVQFNCFSEQKGVMISRKRACFSTNLFDEEKPSEQLDDAVDEKAENAEISHNDNNSKLIIRPSLSEFPFFSFTLLVSHCFSFHILLQTPP